LAPHDRRDLSRSDGQVDVPQHLTLAESLWMPSTRRRIGPTGLVRDAGPHRLSTTALA
jgi:hypothetical protein